ncbi:MAG TPA: hypothetical protein VN672_09245 [Solirubrobacteraceae bacterium]|nr:hypothetical protein [Solirubrobacteraceae bacterium]
MSIWLRAGPLKLSSRGRVGVRVGPVSAYGGGRRRRSGDVSGWGLLVGFALVALVIYAIYLAVMWPLSLWGHALHLTPSFHELRNRNGVWMHHHYPLVGLRYVGAAALGLLALAIVSLPLISRGKRASAEARAAEATARQQRQLEDAERAETQKREATEQRVALAAKAEQIHAEWLSGPPPALQFPGRVTATWIANHVPHLHPGQVPVLLAELRRRGWTEEDITARINPYLPAA